MNNQIKEKIIFLNQLAKIEIKNIKNKITEEKKDIINYKELITLTNEEKKDIINTIEKNIKKLNIQIDYIKKFTTENKHNDYNNSSLIEKTLKKVL